MERNQMDFYKLYSCAVGVPDDLPIEEMDAEDLILAESMCEIGLTKFMEIKTRVLNAKHKLQTSDMQRGVLPQTEEGKEGVCVEAVALEKETVQFKANFSKAEGRGGGLQSYESSIFRSEPFLRRKSS
jgi:hypothetical protein